MEDARPDRIRNAVRESYAAKAKPDAPASSTCCGGAPCVETVAAQLGYSAAEIAAIPDGANLGLGCGNPQAIAALRPGEVLLDLGSGGGLDCFLAARQVGPSGHVIGVDMTPEMLSLARENARKAGCANVEFRLGEIEHLPVADNTIDAILSNCVINLSPDKPQVYREAFRVLKPGGRLAISDVVATVALPPDIRDNWAAMTGCVAGAAPIEDLRAMIRGAGFADVRITPKDESRAFIATWIPGSKVEDYVVSASIQAVKPARCCCG